MSLLEEIAEAAERPSYDFFKAAEVAAKEVGCIVIYPDSDQLQLDIDSEEAFELYQKRMAEIWGDTKQLYTLACEPVITPSKSGLPNRHVTLTFSDRVFSPWERIGLQLLLGSDPLREALSVKRLISGDCEPSRLFEPEAKLRKS